MAAGQPAAAQRESCSVSPPPAQLATHHRPRPSKPHRSAAIATLFLRSPWASSAPRRRSPRGPPGARRRPPGAASPRGRSRASATTSRTTMTWRSSSAACTTRSASTSSGRLSGGVCPGGVVAAALRIRGMPEGSRGLGASPAAVLAGGPAPRDLRVARTSAACSLPFETRAGGGNPRRKRRTPCWEHGLGDSKARSLDTCVVV